MVSDPPFARRQPKHAGLSGSADAILAAPRSTATDERELHELPPLIPSTGGAVGPASTSGSGTPAKSHSPISSIRCHKQPTVATRDVERTLRSEPDFEAVRTPLERGGDSSHSINTRRHKKPNQAGRRPTTGTGQDPTLKNRTESNSGNLLVTFLLSPASGLLPAIGTLV
jgi:hypothetical protein